MVGGGCAWESYIKSTWDCSSRISFMSEGVEVQFAFEFIESDTGPRVLRRIAARVDHPSFAWRCHPDSAVTVARRFDEQAAFMLWLRGWNFAANSHELKTLSGKRSERSGSAPLKELWGYRDRERKLGAFLRKDSFYQPFLYWAARYLKITSVDNILETNQSLIELIANKISQRQRESHLKLNKVKRQAKVLNQSKIQEQAIKQFNKQDKDMGNPSPEGWKHTVTIKKARANSIDYHLRDRGIIFHIPYNKQDMEALRSQGEIEVVLTVHFVEHQQNDPDKSFSYCAPHAQRYNLAYGMQIICTTMPRKTVSLHAERFGLLRENLGGNEKNFPINDCVR